MSALESNAFFMIYFLSVIGLCYGGYNFYKINRVKILPLTGEKKLKTKEEEDDEELSGEKPSIVLTPEQITQLNHISQLISDGADVFLFKEYYILVFFLIIFGVFIFLFGEYKFLYFYTTFAFIVGACTSALAGYIGMKTATIANAKTVYKS